MGRPVDNSDYRSYNVIWRVHKKAHEMARSILVSVRLHPTAYDMARELARRAGRPLGHIVRELAEEALRHGAPVAR